MEGIKTRNYARWAWQFAGVLALLMCFGCHHHYCPTYSSPTYNENFTYFGEKYMTYKPVKVHEFKRQKKEKKDKSTGQKIR